MKGLRAALGLALGLALSCPARAEPAAACDCPRRAEEAEGAQVDLNAATAEQLERLPGLGPAKAKAVVEYRNAHHGFTKLTQLLQVKGIGRALFRRLREHLLLGQAPSAP